MFYPDKTCSRRRGTISSFLKVKNPFPEVSCRCPFSCPTGQIWLSCPFLKQSLPKAMIPTITKIRMDAGNIRDHHFIALLLLMLSIVCNGRHQGKSYKHRGFDCGVFCCRTLLLAQCYVNHSFQNLQKSSSVLWGHVAEAAAGGEGLVSLSPHLGRRHPLVGFLHWPWVCRRNISLKCVNLGLRGVVLAFKSFGWLPCLHVDHSSLSLMALV